MVGFGDLLSLAKNNADWLIPAGSALAGGIMGGKDQKTTSTSAPNLPENYKKGYDKLLADAEAAYARPYNAAPTTRVSAPANAFQALFANPEMLQLQAQSDANYAAQPQVTPQPPAAQPTPQPMQDAGMTALLMAGGNRSPSKMNSFGNSGIDWLDSPKQAARRVALANGQDGQVNQFTGGTYNKARAMELLGKASNNTITPQERQELDELSGTLTYDPTQNLLSKVSPYLATAILLGPAAAAGAFLPGPIQPGMLSGIQAAAAAPGASSIFSKLAAGAGK